MDMVRQLEAISRLAYTIYGFASLMLRRRHPGPGRPDLPGARRAVHGEVRRTAPCSSACGGKTWTTANAERLMAGAGDYRYWLEEMRHFKPHTLTEPEEKIINIKNVTGVERPAQPVRFHHQPLCRSSWRWMAR